MSQTSDKAVTDQEAAGGPSQMRREPKLRDRSKQRVQLRLTITPSMGAWRLLQAVDEEDRRFLAYTLLEYGTDAKEGLRRGGFVRTQVDGGSAGPEEHQFSRASLSARPLDQSVPAGDEQLRVKIARMKFGDFTLDPPVLGMQ